MVMCDICKQHPSNNGEMTNAHTSFYQFMVGSGIKDIVIGVGGCWFNSGPCQIGHCRQRLATAAMFLRSCVALALNPGGGPRHSLYASA